MRPGSWDGDIMGWLKNLVWPLIKGQIQVWLSTRALQIPYADRAALIAIMAQAQTDSAKLDIVNDALKARALAELDRFKP